MTRKQIGWLAGSLVLVGAMALGAGGLSGGGGTNLAATGLSIIPTADVTYNLGSQTLRWSAAFLSSLRDGNNVIRYSGASISGTDLRGAIADGAGAQAFRVGNSAALSNATAEIYSFYSDDMSTKRLSIMADGTIGLKNTTATGLLTSDTNAATATTSVGAFTLYPTATLDANDLLLNVKPSSGGSSVFSVDKEGDVFMGSLNDSSGSARFTAANGAQTSVNGEAPSDGGAVGIIIQNTVSLTTAGDKVASFKQGGAEQASVDFHGFYRQPLQTLTVADNANGGTAATATLTATSNYIKCTCNDPQGCTITMDETGAQDGTRIDIISTTSTACNFADTAGVTELTGAIALGQYDVLSLLYLTDRWVQVGTSNN